jgi:hypothetical protein
MICGEIFCNIDGSNNWLYCQSWSRHYHGRATLNGLYLPRDSLVLGDFLVDWAPAHLLRSLLMRGKIQLLRYLCTQITDEGSRSDMPLTQEECEAVISCVQELELHVLQQDCHTA